MKQWSEYQRAIFEFVKNGAGNAVVQAVAGSGKTTTIIEALNHVSGSHLFLAFNKHIATELKNRGVNARTFHSLTYSVVMRSRGLKEVDSSKMKSIASTLFQQSNLNKNHYQSFCLKLVGLGKNAGIGIVVPNESSEWAKIVAHHDLALDDATASMDSAISISQALLDISNKSKLVDFDDLLYFAVKDSLVLPKFDFVFVDEAQDTNTLQRLILNKILHPKSRLVAVGDSAQAIYGFRGADSKSLELIAQEFNAKYFPLTVTYRCPKKVAEFAMRYCPVLESAPNAEEGEVEELLEWSTSQFKANDLVVCRTSKPLLMLGYEMLRARKPFYILGQEFGAGLKKLIRGFAPEDINDLELKIDRWCNREVAKFLSRDDEASAANIKDKASCLLFLIDSVCSAEGESVYAVERVIDELFAVRDNAVVLSTVHKAKGLEFDRVWWLNFSQCPSKWAKKDWQIKQEYNICYVAATRARKSLYLIEQELEA